MSGTGDSDARLQRSISDLFSEDDDISFDNSTEQEGLGEDTETDAWTGNFY